MIRAAAATTAAQSSQNENHNANVNANANEIETTTTRLACQQNCHASVGNTPPPPPLPCAASASRRFVSFRVTFTSTIQQTIGKCGHKAMTVATVAATRLAFLPAPPSLLPVCLAVCLRMHKAETDADAEIHVCVL